MTEKWKGPKVLVTGCKGDNKWYKKKIGKKYRLLTEHYDCYRVYVGKDKPARYIFKEDSKLIGKNRQEPKPMFEEATNYNHPKGHKLFLRRSNSDPKVIHWVERDTDGKQIEQGFITKRQCVAIAKHKFSE